MYPEQHNYLIHWLKKGEKAKYVDKIKLANGRWRYFYSQAELDAYKLKQKLSTSAGELAGKAKQGLHGLKEGALDVGARAVVGVARRDSSIAGRLGAHEKGHANHERQLANEHLANARRLQSSSEREMAKSASAYRRGWDDRGDDALRRSEKLRSQAKEESSGASYWQGRAAENQKKYESSILGKAEARVAADNRRKAQQPARKSSGESLGAKASRALGKAKEAAADRAAEAVVGAASRNETVRRAAGGKHQDNAKEWKNKADANQREARYADKRAHEDAARAGSQDRKYGSGGDALRRSSEINRSNADAYARAASVDRTRSADEQKAYENSLLGRAQARVNRKGKKKSSSKKKTNRLNLSGGNYAVFQDAKIGR